MWLGLDASAAPMPSDYLDRILRWWPSETADAVRLGVTALAAVYLAMYFELDEPHWAGWTVFSVSLATRASSIQKSTWRAFSTVLGGAAGIVMMDHFAQSTLAYDIALALWLGTMAYFSSLERGLGSYGFALMGYTVPIVTLGNVEAPLQTFDTVANRCSALVLGIGCAYVSSVLVARGTSAVRKKLSDAVEAVARECADWAKASRDKSVWRSPPVGSVLKLDRQIADALTEQPSLRISAHTVCRVPRLLLRLIADGLRRARLDDQTGGQVGKLDRIAKIARSFERHPGYGLQSASTQPLAIDHDTAQAACNALRTIIAVSLVNAFWYASGWSAGATATTWAGVVCIVLSSRPDAASTARYFLLGGALAIAVGLFIRYVALTVTGSYALLAAVLFPCCFLAALARSDIRAKAGPGYAFTVLGVVSPQNTMTYDLVTSLNNALAQLIGIGVVVTAFSALLPPATPESRRLRVMRRMLRDFRAAARRPSALLPRPDRWLARMFDRLEQISTESRAIQEAGQTLILVGQALLRLRDIDDNLRRHAGAMVTAPGVNVDDICASLRQLSFDAAKNPGSMAQRELLAIAHLLESEKDVIAAWPMGLRDLSSERMSR
jgi:uncharacterized membrane protein YccC